MNAEQKTLHEHAAKYFQRPEPVQPVTLEEGGTIIGGVIFVRGERDYEMVRSCFKTQANAELSAPPDAPAIKRGDIFKCVVCGQPEQALTHSSGRLVCTKCARKSCDADLNRRGAETQSGSDKGNESPASDSASLRLCGGKTS